MKKASFIIVPIILLSCSGNNSVRKQEKVDVDSAVVDTMNVQPIKEEKQKESVKSKTVDPIVGTYYCYRTQDTYVFLSDNTGYFTVQGGSSSGFAWKRSGKNVTIVYEVFGKQKLKFDSQTQSLAEESKSLGTLVFDKQ